MTKHKWHDEIVAWASGAEIEYNNVDSDGWLLDRNPQWDDSNFNFRIKPQPKQPKYLYYYRRIDGIYISEYPTISNPHMFIGRIEVQND